MGNPIGQAFALKIYQIFPDTCRNKISYRNRVLIVLFRKYKQKNTPLQRDVSFNVSCL